MNSSGRRILVVEDEPLINQSVTNRLLAEGYDVTQAWDGPTAVKLGKSSTRTWCFSMSCSPVLTV